MSPTGIKYPGPTSRPQSIEETMERMQYFRSPEAEESVVNFATRASDVFIATYSKSGTTWMQHVVHQVRTGGNVDFDEVTVVVPWLESAVDMGMNPEAEQLGGFRAFKSHMMYSQLPQGGRYITVFRNPDTVLPSFFSFFNGWMFESGKVSLEQFAEKFYFEGTEAGRHWNHFIDWWPKISQSDTLALCYEDMARAPDDVPAVVADFLGIEINDTTMAQVIQNCSRDYMLTNVSQFDDHFMRNIQDPLLGIPQGGNAAKVTDGRSKVVVSDELKETMQNIWNEVVTPALGFKNYQEFRQALPNPLGVDRN